MHWTRLATTLFIFISGINLSAAGDAGGKPFVTDDFVARVLALGKFTKRERLDPLTLGAMRSVVLEFRDTNLFMLADAVDRRIREDAMRWATPPRKPHQTRPVPLNDFRDEFQWILSLLVSLNHSRKNELWRAKDYSLYGMYDRDRPVLSGSIRFTLTPNEWPIDSQGNLKFNFVYKSGPGRSFFPPYRPQPISVWIRTLNIPKRPFVAGALPLRSGRRVACVP